MNAVDFLKQEHREVEQLFQQILNDRQNATQLIPQLRQSLLAHAQIEERHFYPAVGGLDELRDMVKEALQEHRQVEKQLMQLSSMSIDGGQWETVITQLQQDVDHHVREEEGEMFPKVLRLMDQEQLNQIGQQLQEAKAREVASR